MRMQNAMDLIAKAGGYRVHFERRENGLLASDFFPDKDEPPIAEEEEAWKLAAAFATVNPAVFVNIYVIYAVNFVPVKGFAEQRLNAHPCQRN